MILPCITTTFNSNWKEKIKNTNLEELAIFLTCLEERKEFYYLLKKSQIKKIPFVHLRSDMKKSELDFFVREYQTKVFCLHSHKDYAHLYDYQEHKKNIFIENSHDYLPEKEINDYAGVCLDFSHLESDRKENSKRFFYNKKIIGKYKIGCNHISSVKEKKVKGKYDNHYLEKLTELDYLKTYPIKYFSNFIALELENDLEEQLKIKKYIEKIIWK